MSNLQNQNPFNGNGNNNAKGSSNNPIDLSVLKHKDVGLRLLEQMGTVFNVYNTAGFACLVFRLDASSNTVVGKTAIDMSSNKDENKKIFEAIIANPVVRMYDDNGYVMSSKEIMGDLLDMANLYDFSPLWVNFEFTKPETVGDLVAKVDEIRSDLLS